LAGLLLIALFWGFTLRGIENEQQESDQAAQRALANLSRLTQEHASRTLRAADQALQLIRMNYLRDGHALDLGDMVAKGAIDASIFPQVGIIDERGIYRLSNLPTTPAVDLSDREHFKVHVAKDSGQIFVSKPVLGRVTKRWSIQLSRRINHPDGSFGGVAVVSVDVGYFSAFYASLDLGRDGIAALVGRDGVVRARYAHGSTQIGQRIENPLGLTFFAQGKTEGYSEGLSRLDQLRRLYYFRQIPGFPLWVTVAFGADEYRTAQLNSKHADLLQTSELTLLLVSMALLFSWHRWREARNHRSVILSEERLNLALDGGGLALWDWDLDHGEFVVNERLARMLGYPANEFKADNQRFQALLHPDDWPALRQTLHSVVKGLTPQFVFEHRLRHKDGHWVWLLARGKVTQRDAHGRAIRLVGTNVDISQRKQSEQALHIAAVAFESSQAMVVSNVDQQILRVNPAFIELSGYSAAELIGQQTNIMKSDRHDARFYAALWQSLRDSGHWQGEIWNRRKNGEIFPDWLRISSVKDPQGAVTHYVSLHTDITDRKRAEEEIKRLAFHDALTGLPNRRLLLDRLEQVRSASKRSVQHGALLFLDLDRFKRLNDTEGHHLGDLLLQQVAQRLLACVREVDTVARIGGDEFVVMLTELSAAPMQATARARTVSEKVLAALGQAYDLNGTRWQSTVSIGVAVFIANQRSSEEILQAADQAMYLAKAEGRNTVRLADLSAPPSADPAAQRRSA
jgi:diguanylate cyclase (GGDEF)-like protein/PAS domain S-box-containing protein